MFGLSVRLKVLYSAQGLQGLFGDGVDAGKELVVCGRYRPKEIESNHRLDYTRQKMRFSRASCSE